MSWQIDLDNEVDTVTGPNSSLKIARLGAEPISLKINHPKNGLTGILVNDDILLPNVSYWKRHAPFLFPIIGGLVNNKSVTTNGEEIKLPNHGFARATIFNLIDSGSEKSSAWLEYRLNKSMLSNEYVYPWDFELTIKFVLSDNNLATNITIKNLSSSLMYYQFGWHPGFKTPILGSGTRSDVDLLLPNYSATRLEVNNDALLTGKSNKEQLGGKYIFTEEELEDTIVLNLDDSDKTSRWAILDDKVSGIRTKIEFPDYPQLGLWGMKSSPYVCIEPWQGADDHVEQENFDKKLGVKTLLPNEENSSFINIEIDYLRS